MACGFSVSAGPAVEEVRNTFLLLKQYASNAYTQVGSAIAAYASVAGEAAVPPISSTPVAPVPPSFDQVGAPPYGEPGNFSDSGIDDIYVPQYTDVSLEDIDFEDIPDPPEHSSDELQFGSPPGIYIDLAVAEPDPLTLSTMDLPAPFTVNVPNIPGHSVSELDFSGMPGALELVLPVAPEHSVGELDLSGAPAPISVTIPDDVPVLDEPSLPSAPSIALPTLPTLSNVPSVDIPALTIPIFSAIAPDGLISLPTVIEPAPEEEYSSALLVRLQSTILNVLNGNRGYLDEVWDMVWGREARNESDAALAAQEEIMELWGSRGWEAPGGAEAEQLFKITQGLQNSASARAREIAIEQNKQEVARFNFFVSQGLALESMLIQLFAGAAERELRRVEVFNNAALAFLQARVAKLNADLAIYKTKAEVHRDLISAELAKLQLVEAEIKIASLIGEQDQRKISLYVAQLEGVSKDIQLYVAQLEGVKSTYEINRAKVQLFAERLNAVKLGLEAKKLEYEGYETKIRGELGKTQAWDVEARIYAAQIEGAKTAISAKQLEYVGYETKVKAELGKTQAWAVEAQIHASRIAAERLGIESKQLEYAGYEAFNKGQMTAAQVYDSLVKLYGEKIKGKGLLVDASKLDVEKYDITVKSELGKTQAWDAEARVYAAQIQGITADNQMKREAFRDALALNDFEIKKQANSVEVFKAQLAKATEEFKAGVEVDNANRLSYSAEAQSKAASNNMKAQQYSGDIAYYNNLNQLALATAQSNAANSLRLTEIQVKSLESIAQIYGTVASSALAALNASASMSNSGSEIDTFNTECG